ncbi:MAG: acyltransferase family protein [Brevinema sp.]
MKEKYIEDKSITWLRAIATIMVVSIHIFDVSDFFKNINFHPYARTITDSLMRVCVPIFAMISGHLLWHKNTESSISLAYKRSWIIFKIIAYFGIIYYLYDTFTGKGYYNFFNVFWNTETTGLWRIFLWYMFAVLPLYTLSSFISLPLNKSQRFYVGFSVMLMLIFFITESIKVFPFNISSHYSLNYLFLYFLLGFSLGQIKFSKKYWYLFFNFYIIIALTIILFLKLFPEKRRWDIYGYHSFLIMIQSSTFFIFIRSLDFNKILSYKIGRILDRILQLFAKYSIAIYGWHAIVLNTLYIQLQQTNLRRTIIMLITVIAVLVTVLLIGIIETYFWRNINKRLAPCYNYINNKFITLTKKYNI